MNNTKPAEIPKYTDDEMLRTSYRPFPDADKGGGRSLALWQHIKDAAKFQTLQCQYKYEMTRGNEWTMIIKIQRDQ